MMLPIRKARWLVTWQLLHLHLRFVLLNILYPRSRHSNLAAISALLSSIPIASF
jgi:hypothetical protein